MHLLLYFIFNKSDASIKIKTLDATTNNNGIYTRANDIIVLNVVSTHKLPVISFIITAYIMYLMHVSDDKNTLSIECFTGVYYVDLDDLSKYINDKSSIDQIRSYGHVASNYNIRIYYI